MNPTEPTTTIVPVADRPDLVPLVAGWLWDAFWRHDGYSLAQTQALVAASTSRLGPPQCFVLLANGEPMGTASLTAEDFDERPDLTPWLAGVFIVPAARGRGYAARLVASVEAACRAASISTLWLYTHTAERIYARVGWRTVEHLEHHGRQTYLMRRDLE
jgi:GNAT superfamily N-acetyltransferase